MEAETSWKQKSTIAGTVARGTPGTVFATAKIKYFLFSSQKVFSVSGIPGDFFFFSQWHYLNLTEERAKLDGLGEEGQTGCMVM